MRPVVLSCCVPSVLNNMARISDEKFVPTASDVLNARQETLALQEYELEINGARIQ